MMILAPRTLTEALEAASFYTDYHFLAGGSDSILRHKKENSIAGMIWLGKIEELREISYSEKRVRIGSMVTLTSLSEEAKLMEYFPLLSKAIAVFGSHQIRCVATIGGNIANASAAADLIPVLMVLEASIEITSPNGRRLVTIEELIPRYRHSTLEHNEIITAIHLPLKN
jgi:CO/xanthine dehydrogenase FAD-binding subunit